MKKRKCKKSERWWWGGGCRHFPVKLSKNQIDLLPSNTSKSSPLFLLLPLHHLLLFFSLFISRLLLFFRLLPPPLTLLSSSSSSYTVSSFNIVQIKYNRKQTSHDWAISPFICTALRASPAWHDLVDLTKSVHFTFRYCFPYRSTIIHRRRWCHRFVNDNVSSDQTSQIRWKTVRQSNDDRSNFSRNSNRSHSSFWASEHSTDESNHL